MSQLMQVGVVSESNANPLPTKRNRCFESGRLRRNSEVPFLKTNRLFWKGFPRICYFPGIVAQARDDGYVPQFYNFDNTYFLQDFADGKV